MSKGKGNDYHRLSLAEKAKYQREAVRPPPVRCPCCDLGTTAEGLIAHLNRCEGPPPAHPFAQWVTVREAVAFGCAKRSLYRWVGGGKVRAQDCDDGRRRYLLRDIAKAMAIARAAGRAQ